jgi:hypothetical protein
MKAPLLILVLFTLMFSACKKEVPTVKVTYIVRELSQAAPEYSITYTGDISGGSNVASNNDNYWSSDVLELKQGQFVSLKSECTDPEYQIKLTINVNGQIWKEEIFSNPNGSLTISGNLPSE